MDNKTRFSITLKEPYTEGLHEIVSVGLYMDPQDAIRKALQDLFEKHGVEAFKDRRQPKTIERKRN